MPLWPMVNFRLKVAQIWDLSSKIQGFEVLGFAPAKTSNPWISDDKSQIWATFRQKLTIGHKSTYSSFEKLIYQNFFLLTKFSLFDKVASFDLDFLASPEGYKKFFFAGWFCFSHRYWKQHPFNCVFFLRDRRMSQVRVKMLIKIR